MLLVREGPLFTTKALTALLPNHWAPLLVRPPLPLSMSYISTHPIHFYVDCPPPIVALEMPQPPKAHPHLTPNLLTSRIESPAPTGVQDAPPITLQRGTGRNCYKPVDGTGRQARGISSVSLCMTSSVSAPGCTLCHLA